MSVQVKCRSRFPDQYVWLGLAAIVLLTLPNFVSFNLLTILTLANIWAVFAMSWDILSGYTGQINFGHAFSIGIGGYFSALASIWSAEWFGEPLAIPVTILIGGLMGSLGYVLLSLPAVRLRGPYLSLMTLIAALAVERIIRLLKVESSGAEGSIIGFANFGFDFKANFYYSVFLALGVALVLVILGGSRIGKVFEAIRESEGAAEAAGLNTAKYKMIAFAISGFFGGVGGAFYAHYLGSISPVSHFALDISIISIVAAVIGGMGTIVGPLAGAYLFIIIQEYFRPFGNWRFLMLFTVAFAVLYFLPRGYLTEMRIRLFRLFRFTKKSKETST